MSRHGHWARTNIGLKAQGCSLINMNLSYEISYDFNQNVWTMIPGYDNLMQLLLILTWNLTWIVLAHQKFYKFPRPRKRGIETHIVLHKKCLARTLTDWAEWTHTYVDRERVEEEEREKGREQEEKSSFNRLKMILMITKKMLADT